MSLPRYGECKDSGVPWLGILPNHWGVKKLGYGFLQPPCYGVLVPDFQAGGVPMVRIMDMQKGKVVREELTTISRDLSSQYSRTLTESGDVLLSVVGTIGEVVHVVDDLAGVNLSRAVARLQPDENELNRRFLGWLLQSSSFGTYVDLICVGSAQRVLNLGDLSAFRAGFPTCAEQLAIAAFLDRETAKIDALITEQEKLIVLLVEKRQATVSHAVSRGLNPHAPMKDSGMEWLGEVPAHWTVCTVRRVLRRIEQGWSPECFSRPAEKGEWGVLKTGCVNGGIFAPSENKALPDTLEPDLSIEVRNGDLLMSRASGSPALVGSVAYVSEPPAHLMLSDKIFRLHLKQGVLPQFFAIAFRARCIRLQIEQAISGAEGLANNLPQSSLKSFVIAIPPESEQTELIHIVKTEMSKLDALTYEAERAIALLKERRSALISAAVTGQIDVRGAVNSEAA